MQIFLDFFLQNMVFTTVCLLLLQHFQYTVTYISKATEYKSGRQKQFFYIYCFLRETSFIYIILLIGHSCHINHSYKLKRFHRDLHGHARSLGIQACNNVLDWQMRNVKQSKQVKEYKQSSKYTQLTEVGQLPQYLALMF